MDTQDHNLLVVSLDNCITSGGNLGKNSNCTYTAACGHEGSVLEIATPVQCLGTAIPRLQHQHMSQLQTVQYPQAVSYEPAQHVQQLHQHGNIVTSHAIYQSVGTGSLHHYTSTQAMLGNNSYLNTNTGQTIHLAPALSHQPQVLNHLPVLPESHHLAPNPIPAEDDPEINLTVDEPTFPEDDFEYYEEIRCYLSKDEFPQGVSDNYKKHLRKRAQHYMILDGKLYHNRKQPKEVVMKKDDQQNMVKDIHVVKDTGVHLGVKKMFNKLQAKHFWRGMYIDVVSYVKNCEKCSDIVDMAKQKQLQGEENEDVDDPASLVQCTVGIQCSRSWKTWKKVEVWIHGPLSRTAQEQEHLLTIVDPESRWVVACPVPANANLPSRAAMIGDFLFHTFCTYGFAHCSLVGFSVELKNSLYEELRWRLRNSTEIPLEELELVEETEAVCQWVTKLVEHLVHSYTEWDQNLNHFLFQYRTGQLKAFRHSCTPFSVLFNRNPLLNYNAPEENKENVDGGSLISKRRKLNKMELSKQCDDVDTVSYECVNNKKCEDDKTKEGPGKMRVQGEKEKIIRRGVLKPSELACKTATSEKPAEACLENTVSAVKAFLTATKEERRRRGKYNKYTPELQEHMATYAIKHGSQQAVKFFSDQLGVVVSGSTVRNMIKVHSAFGPSLKEEIGRFATNFGIESAARYFSDKLKRDVPQSLVRKFKIMHLEKVPDINKSQKNIRKPKDFKKKCAMKRDVILMNSGKMKRYSIKLKEEIGLYACSHTVSETVEHFSGRLQGTVKESTVKRLKKYLAKYNSQSNSAEIRVQPPEDSSRNTADSMQLTIAMQTPQQPQSSSIYSTASFAQQIINTATPLLPQPQPQPQIYHQLNQCSNVNDCYQTPVSSSVIMSQNNSSFQYQNINSVNNFQDPNQIYSHNNMPPDTQNPSQSDNISYVMTQHPLIVSQETSNGIPVDFMSPQCSRTGTNTGTQDQTMQINVKPNEESNVAFITIKCDLESEDLPRKNNNNAVRSQSNVVSCLKKEVTETSSGGSQDHELSEGDNEEIEEDEQEEEEPVGRLRPVLQKREKTKKEETSKKRGSYTAYSPELRAEIGKYAAEHGSIKTCQHFGSMLGHEVPESTVRGLREKYLKKKAHCTVTSLGYSQRGRPLRLGKYDEVVQGCLKELVRSGEKVSSFLAITTAKQILNNCEPGLLEDNGGPIKLNTTWAKSFLKRIGVHNNS